MRRKSCILLPAAGRRTQLFHLIFSEPGVHLLVHPCMCIVLCISIACKGKSARVPSLCGKIWGRMTTRTRFDLSIYYICDLNPIQSFKCEERARESHDCITRSRARVRVVIRPLRQQQQRRQNIQISARRRSPGLVKFVPAVAQHFSLALPAAFTQPGAPPFS